ncbi:hypothetical protein V3C99_009759, partial [Haemonchus contortus]
SAMAQRFCNRVAIGIMILVLFDHGLCLSEKGRLALQKALPNVDLKKRHERLQKLGGLRGRGRSNSTRPIPTLPNLTREDGALAGEEMSSGSDGSSIVAVNSVEGLDEYLFEGDILLTDEELSALENENDEDGVENSARKKRQISSISTNWENNTVFYYFDASIGAANQAYIRSTLKYLSSRTCIDFVENPTAPNRIQVFDGSGCYSSVGMKGNEQTISLAQGCIVIGTVAHEFMHALGALHMHMRDDRDDHLRVDLTNVPEAKQSNFLKQTRSINHSPYEYGSTMHYSRDAFTTSGDSMIPLIPRFKQTMGTKTISFYDLHMINAQYKCYAACAGKIPSCVNGGVPNPRNCAVCNCPAGYGGALCNLRTAWQTKKVTVGDATMTTTSQSYKMCVDWIKAPAGKKVQIRVTALQGVKCNDGCWTHAIEAKIMADKKMTNSRICCSGQLNQIWPSALNPTPIVSYSIRQAATFTYQYRYV